MIFSFVWHPIARSSKMGNIGMKSGDNHLLYITNYIDVVSVLKSFLVRQIHCQHHIVIYGVPFFLVNYYHIMYFFLACLTFLPFGFKIRGKWNLFLSSGFIFKIVTGIFFFFGLSGWSCVWCCAVHIVLACLCCCSLSLWV